MISDAEVHKIFQDVRREFAYPPIRLKLAHTQTPNGSPFYIERMTVHMEVGKIADEKHCVSLIRHELGHPHFAPISMQNDFEYFSWAVEKHYLTPKIANLLLNVAYDVIVDYTLATQMNDDIDHRIKLSLSGKSPESLQNSSKWFQYLTVFYGALSGSGRKYGDFTQDLRSRVAQSLRVCRHPDPLRVKVRKLVNILVELMEDELKDGKKQNEVQEQIEQAHHDMKPAPCHVTTKDEIHGTEKEALEELAASINIHSSSEKRKFFDYAGERGIKMNDLDLLRAQARRNIRFHVTGASAHGPSRAAGHILWNPSDPVESMDIQQGLTHYGINIPGVTTLKALHLPGGYLPGNDESCAVVFVLDTSGSMNREDGLITLFSLIAAAEKQGRPVGILLFSDFPYLNLPSSKHYRLIEEQVFRGYQGGGTQICPALKVAESFGSGNLVLVVSDFNAEAIEQIDASLMQLAQSNIVRPIVLSCGNAGTVPGVLSPIEITHKDQLNEIVIEQTSSFSSAQ